MESRVWEIESKAFLLTSMYMYSLVQVYMCACVAHVSSGN